MLDDIEKDFDSRAGRNVRFSGITKVEYDDCLCGCTCSECNLAVLRDEDECDEIAVSQPLRCICQQCDFANMRIGDKGSCPAACCQGLGQCGSGPCPGCPVTESNRANYQDKATGSPDSEFKGVPSVGSKDVTAMPDEQLDCREHLTPQVNSSETFDTDFKLTGDFDGLGVACSSQELCESHHDSEDKTIRPLSVASTVALGDHEPDTTGTRSGRDEMGKNCSDEEEDHVDIAEEDIEESHGLTAEDNPPHGPDETDQGGACSCRDRRQQNTRSHLAVLCTFSIMFLAIGIMSSFGVFYVELLDYFGSSPSSTTLIGSINSGVCHAAGPLVGMIEGRIGIRRTVALGGLLSALGLVISGFMPSVVLLYFSYGFLSGTGFAIAYTASLGMLASHFDNQRSLDIAVGISTSGMGFGCLALPPLIRVTIDVYGWHGAMVLCGGLVLNVIVFALASGPRKPRSTELVRSLSMGSVAYLRTEKDTGLKDDNIVLSMSMTSVYIMKDTEHPPSVTDAAEVTTKMNGARATSGYAARATNMAAEPAYLLREPLKRICKRFPQLSVVRNRIFLLILLSEILSNMTMSIVLTTVPDFAHCNGHDGFRASFLLSIFGITATLGRLYLSLFSAAIRKFKSNKRATIATTNFISMIAALCISFAGDNYYLMGFLVGLFGVTTGARGVFISCIVIKLCGAENTIFAVGLLGLCCGIGHFGGPPLAGTIYTSTGWYPVVYCFGAGASLLAALCSVVVIVIHVRGKTSRSRSRSL